MRPLTSTERIFLRLERRGYPIDVVGITVFEPHAEGPVPFRVVYERMDQALTLSPHLSRRLSQAPLGIGEDHWIEAEDFDLDEHVHHVECPEPRDERALLDLMLDLCDEPLDRRRPLWVCWYVTGMSEGRSALVLRGHHALTDGLGFMNLYKHVFDADEHGTPPGEREDADFAYLEETIGTYVGPQTQTTGESEPPVALRAVYEVPERVAHTAVTTARIARTIAGGVPSLVSGAAGTVARKVGDVLTTQEDASADGQPAAGTHTDSAARPAKTTLAAETPRGTDAPAARRSRMPKLPHFIPSPTNHPPVTRFQAHVTDTTKSFAVATVSMADIETARTCCPGATVNDVILAMVTGALRRYLDGHGELPDEPLLTTCPVSVRKDSGSGGNEFTTIWVELPVHVADPLERLAIVHASAHRSKGGVHRSRRSWDVLADVGDLFLPGVVSAAMVFAGSKVFTKLPPTLNLSVSTLRGSAEPLYLAKRRAEHLYARTIVCPPVHLFIHAITYAGHADLGVLSLRQLLPDPDTLAEGLKTELDLLLERAPAG